MNEHRATFEAGPSGHVNGEKVQLVYTRAEDTVTPSAMRFHALRAAIDTDRVDFSKAIDDTQVGDRVLALAALYLTFLEGDVPE